MLTYKEINWFILIKRNILLLVVKILKSIFFIFTSIVIFYFSILFFDKLSNIDWLKYVSFIIIFLLTNYAFLNLISSIVEYYNDLIILHEDQIIILKSSLLLNDDMEVIDIDNVIKLDGYKRWILQNILGYWDIIIEQQKNELRVFHFISNPHQMLKILKFQKDKYWNNKDLNAEKNLNTNTKVNKIINNN